MIALASAENLSRLTAAVRMMEGSLSVPLGGGFHCSWIEGSKSAPSPAAGPVSTSIVLTGAKKFLVGATSAATALSNFMSEPCFSFTLFVPTNLTLNYQHQKHCFLLLSWSAPNCHRKIKLGGYLILRSYLLN
jgi:hypothetical protein